MRKKETVRDVHIADSYDIVIVGASSSGAYFVDTWIHHQA